MTRILMISLVAAGCYFQAAAVEPSPQGKLTLWHAPRAMTAADWVWGREEKRAHRFHPFSS